MICPTELERRTAADEYQSALRVWREASDACAAAGNRLDALQGQIVRAREYEKNRARLEAEERAPLVDREELRDMYGIAGGVEIRRVRGNLRHGWVLVFESSVPPGLFRCETRKLVLPGTLAGLFASLRVHPPREATAPADRVVKALLYFGATDDKILATLTTAGVHPSVARERVDSIGPRRKIIEETLRDQLPDGSRVLIEPTPFIGPSIETVRIERANHAAMVAAAGAWEDWKEQKHEELRAFIASL
jgi:hypothetical protein